MSAKKVAPAPPTAQPQELEYLYARRTAIDRLIQSLEEYARFASPPRGDRESQTA